jgi:type II secretory pathway pseudopilin PulG
MFCFKCGASMPEDATVCPQCATPVQAAPAPPPPQQPSSPGSSTPNPAATSAWLNVPPAPAQNPGQYPPPGQPYQQYQPPKTDGGAIASMVLGIASFVLCLSFLSGIPAVIVGHISRSKIKKSGGRLKGDGIALAGLILGYISFLFIPIILAIAIPNVLRARISANEAAARSTVRTINTSQITYSTTYPEQGYARDLATLGPGSSNGCSGGGTAEHACLLDSQLGQANCTSGVWCQRGSYRLTVSSSCAPAHFGDQQQGTENACTEYVIAATPVNSSAGRRNYCSVSDAVIRSRTGFPLTTPPTAEECQTWEPL